MPTINRDGVHIYYEVHGSGPPLLLTHGYSSTSGMWQGQIAALSKHHKLVLWDMRGHGQSDYPEDTSAYSEALTVADMAALLDAVGAEQAIVGGLSLGGYMSLAFYRAHPERVRALLIIDTGPGFKKDEAREVWNKRAHDTGDRFEREGLEVLKSASRERSSVTHRDASGLARAARGMLTQRDARVIESLPDIKVPSLIVVGADDTPFLAASDYMAAKIPGAQKVVIPAAGHAVNIDQPQAFIDAVLPFLDGLDATRQHGKPRHEDSRHGPRPDRRQLRARCRAASCRRSAAPTRRLSPKRCRTTRPWRSAWTPTKPRVRSAPRSIMSGDGRARKSSSRSATSAAADCSTRRTGCFCSSAKAGWPAGRATGATTGCGNSRAFAESRATDFVQPKTRMDDPWDRISN